MTSLFVFPQATSTSTIAPEAPVIPTIELNSEEWVKQRIKHYAEFYDVSEGVMDWVVKCESNYNPNAWGDGGYSRGLVQIHYPAHPTISDEQALNIEFALDFLARNLKEGKGNMWTCWRIMPDIASSAN